MSGRSLLGVALLALAVVGPATGFAAEPPAAETDDLRSTVARHRLELAATVHYFDYREFVPDPLKSEEYGPLPGVALSYRFSDWGLLAQVDFAVSWGDTTYDGSLQDGTPLLDTSTHWFVDWDVRLGARLDQLLFDAPLLIAPWVSVGQHWWNRGLGGPAPFDELYRWLRISFGATFEWPLGPVTLGLEGSVDLMALGAITFELSDTDPAYNDPEADLGARTGGTVRAYLGVPIDDRFEIGLTSWYRYSAILESSEPALVTDDGDPLLAIIEPSSRSHRAGAELGLVLRF